MIFKASLFISKETNPYRNLALEEQLLEGLLDFECILYLWQNQNTVVIGKNQNAWRECKTEELKKAGGFLARRFSGGGAVYHDSGNLNFTFLVKRKDYDEERQLEVILKALEKLGIHGEKTGRNDLAIEGRKFSGNAYYHRGDASCHHGTLLLDVDMGKMQRFLNVSEKKLESKGVKSVKSRVLNLKALCPELTVEGLEEKLAEAFEERYGCRAEPFEEKRIDWKKVEERERFLSSWEWIYGRKIPFQTELSKRFPWGEAQIQAAVDEGRIRDVRIYSDAMEQGFAEPLEEGLRGLPYEEGAFGAAVKAVIEKNGQGPENFGNGIKAWEEVIPDQIRKDLEKLWREGF